MEKKPVVTCYGDQSLFYNLAGRVVQNLPKEPIDWKRLTIGGLLRESGREVGRGVLVVVCIGVVMVVLDGRMTVDLTDTFRFTLVIFS